MCWDISRIIRKNAAIIEINPRKIMYCIANSIKLKYMKEMDRNIPPNINKILKIIKIIYLNLGKLTVS